MEQLFNPFKKLNYGCLKVSISLNYSKNKKVQFPNDSSLRFLNSTSELKNENAICLHLSKHLFGEKCSEKAKIFDWIYFADFSLHTQITNWISPYLGKANYNKQVEMKAEVEVEKFLSVLNLVLVNKTYLVGESVSMADISCASALYAGYRIVLDSTWRKKFVNVTRWFETVINQSEFKSEIPSTDWKDFCEKTPKFDKKKFEEMKIKLESLKNASGDGTKDEKPKTASQLKKEAKKKAKMEKFEAKKLKEQKSSAKNQEKKKRPSNQSAPKVEATYTKDTPPGHKKDVSDPLPDSYSPLYTEAAWYEWWNSEGFFKPEYGKSTEEMKQSKKFVMCLPPPNVTGSLHLGHALTNTVQDVLTRWHRMKGETTLWIPGTDHAGIATQVVVEKQLWKKEKKSRHDLGREKFIEKIWEWKQEKGDRICKQLRQLASSLDWSREFFTMSEKLNYSVKKSFIELRKRKIIFRSNRIINWSCALKSAISDIEVDKKELSGRTLLSVPGYSKKVEFGVIVKFAYRIINSDDVIEVATTRIETMLGDTAIAVHPDDVRYQHLHGKMVSHPFCDRKIPIICDKMVEMEFGTGAVKITPAHDPNDYEVGKRHDLPFINIFNENGDVINTKTRFDGMSRFEAREEVVKDLDRLHLYRDTRDNPMVVPLCSRTKDVVEPMVRVQWFLDCKDVAQRSVDAVKNGDLKIVPEMFKKTWYHWLENIRDWCISRQLWWGHQIPAYYVTIKGQPAGDECDDENWVCGMDEEEALEEASERFAVSKDQICLRQDQDVLDTWYSSGMLPFSVLGWPDQTADLEQFFPGSLLETGHDILFFWIARMVFFSLLLTDRLPFETVYLHAMVRDAHGRKMSKSLGNVIDPIDVINGITLENLHKTLLSGNLDPKEIEKAKLGQKRDFPQGIPQCGSDALRFALFAYTSQGRDINLDVNRILGYRHFCNKLWNAFKFSIKQLGPHFKPSTNLQITGCESSINLWILHKLQLAARSSEEGLTSYNFPQYTTSIFNFWLYELCDVYLESTKPIFAGDDVTAITQTREVLYTCLDVALRLTQPLMPFICEELWQRLPRRPDDVTASICVANWPLEQEFGGWCNDVIDDEMEQVMNVVKTVRSLKSDYNLSKMKADLYVTCSDVTTSKSLSKYQQVIQTLSYSSKVEILSKNQPTPAGCAVAIVNSQCDVSIMLKGIIDFEKEAIKLSKRGDDVIHKIDVLEKKMKKIEYQEKVPEKVQLADQAKIKELKEELVKIQEAESNFRSLLASSK